MSILFSMLFVAAFLAAVGVDPFVVGVSLSIALVAWGVLRIAEVVEDYRYRQRLNHGAFLCAVYAAEQRRREAREACHRA
jgi:hypothetical protein